METHLTIQGKCPSCSRKLRVMPLLGYTEEFTRTCRGCRERWRILAKPKPITGGWVHVLTFTFIPREA